MANVDPSLNPLLQPLAPGATIPPPDGMVTEPAAPHKKQKREKPFLHYNLTDFYNLRKIKYTLAFDDLNKKQLERSQFVYTLDLKEEETIAKLIEAAIKDGHKRMYIDLGVHIKQMQVREIATLGPEDDADQMEDGQSQFAKKTNVNIPEESQTYGTMPSLGTFKAPPDYPDADTKQLQDKKSPLS